MQELLRPAERHHVNQWLMLALVDVAHPDDVTDIQAVREDGADRRVGEVQRVLLVDDELDGCDGSAGEEQVVDVPDCCGAHRVRHEIPVHIVVADGDPAAALPQSGLGTLGAAHGHALANLLTLELGKDREDADHRTAERRGGVEVLGHRHEVTAICEEDVLDHVQRVLLRPREAVELVDKHAVDAPRLYVLEELREGRPLHVGAGEAGVGVGMENPPAFGLAVGL